MPNQEQKYAIIQKLTAARKELLSEYPFYGSMLMYLRFGLAPCGTACTDMKRIIFDPNFAERLDLKELQFIMQHEVLHCILDHCSRGKGLQKEYYNIACDIVVNSNILFSMGADELYIDGKEVMHYAPDGKEGYLYRAEDIYYMLLNGDTDMMPEKGNFLLPGEAGLDTHDVWEEIEDIISSRNEWKEHLKTVGNMTGAGGMAPPGIRQVIEDLNYCPKLDWRDLLRDFVHLHSKDFDYTYTPPDKRYFHMDLVYPAFHEMMIESIEQIYFFVDTSGSIDAEMLSEVFAELKQAVRQVEGLRGKLSFFDTSVTEPVEFDSVESLKKCKPVGGGGTSFHAIFEFLDQMREKEIPKAIVILTDGYARFPDEKAARGIPVLWIIGHSDEKPPWGKWVRYE